MDAGEGREPSPAIPVDGKGELRLEFGQGGNAAGCFGAGWSDPERDETWTVGPASTLILPSPAAPAAGLAGGGPYWLVLHLRPHVADGLAAQRLRVRVAGTLVGAFTLARRTVRACLISADLLRAASTAWGRANASGGHAGASGPAARLEIELETPDAARPADHGGEDRRALGVAVSALRLYPDRLGVAPDAEAPVPVDIEAVLRADRMSLAELMGRFESLGQNCEFGLVQRRAGAERLGLLRFASAPLSNLLAALDAGFAGMGEASAMAVEMSANGREFMVKDARYGIVYHPWVGTGAMTADALRRRETGRVKLLVRKLLEDLGAGEKIFVFKAMGAIVEEVGVALAAALRRYGPNTLLLVTLADRRDSPAAHRAGTVEIRAPGLLVGYLDRFAPVEDAHDFAYDQWVALCRAAWRTTHSRGRDS